MEALPVLCCSICLDESETITFRCSNRACLYKLCSTCVREAFNDCSGSNSSFCQFCKTPSALDMITAVCGPGAIRAVERKIKAGLEFEHKADMVKKESAKQIVSETNIRARHIFNDLTEKINLKCPRCKAVFHDYDGCNALICGSASCKAAFCAICLEDCGRDAHAHVRANHGSLFDKCAFKKSKGIRAMAAVTTTLHKISGESFELVQQVKNHIEKAQLVAAADNEGGEVGANKSRRFLKTAKDALLRATKNDRLSILQKPENYRPGQSRLTENDLSPRSSIPEDVRVTMTDMGNKIYTLRLECQIDDARWKSIALDKVKEELNDRRKVEAISNLKQGIKCAVIAFEGYGGLFQTQHAKPTKEVNLEEEQICISIMSVSTDGSVKGDMNDLHLNRNLQVIALNPNQRMLKLEKHVLRADESELMFESLRHLVGDGDPIAVFGEILRPVPATYNQLNHEQQKVAHPLKLKTAGEVAGPPGTGKTKTIVELVRGLLETTDFDIVVLSERNGAINAIAEKFIEASLNVEQKSVRDMLVWVSLLTYGSGESMGSATKLFTLEGKLNYHPDLNELKEKIDLFATASKQLLMEMKNRIANTIEKFGNDFDSNRAYDRSRLIRETSVDFTSPLVTLHYLTETLEFIQSVFPQNTPSTKVREENVETLVTNHSALLGGLVEVRTTPEKERSPLSWNAKEVTKRLFAIRIAFEGLLEQDIFNENKASELFQKLADVKKDYSSMYKRLSEELPQIARLHMSTIGSSHKLTVLTKAPDLADKLDLLSLNECYEDGACAEAPKKTIVIFDEAGCIPSYELLGVSSLGRDIEALLLVGDKHQLPPYDPSNGNYVKSNSQRTDRFGKTRRHHTHTNEDQPTSLLDSSKLMEGKGKVTLTTQYRVPKDIADMLNAHIYRGLYNSCPCANVPSQGLKIVNVTEAFSCNNRKYVNEAEVARGIALVRDLMNDDQISSILIITPYKKQQREFEFQLKKSNINIPPTVLTIDQCQGQEADAVVLSMVQKPTRFLNKNRLNVALSRVRKELYVLIDTNKLKEACNNRNWDAAPLANEMITYHKDW